MIIQRKIRFIVALLGVACLSMDAPVRGNPVLIGLGWLAEALLQKVVGDVYDDAVGNKADLPQMAADLHAIKERLVQERPDDHASLAVIENLQAHVHPDTTREEYLQLARQALDQLGVQIARNTDAVRENTLAQRETTAASRAQSSETRENTAALRENTAALRGRSTRSSREPDEAEAPSLRSSTGAGNRLPARARDALVVQPVTIVYQHWETYCEPFSYLDRCGYLHRGYRQGRRLVTTRQTFYR